MMQFIRDHAQGWFATLLLGLLCIPFALWGVQSYLDAGRQVNVAEVDGTVISQQEFQVALSRARGALEAELGERAADLDVTALKRQVIDQLVQAELLRTVARRASLRVGDGMVAGEITTLPAFLRDGVFAADLYADRLRNSGMTRRSFEEQLRDEMMFEQLRQGVAATAFVTPAERTRVALLKSERRDVRFVQFLVDDEVKKLNPGDAELQAWFAAHPDDYPGEVSIKLEYLYLSAADLVTDETPAPEVLQAAYEESRALHTRPEERRVRHLLIEVPRDADAAVVRAAEARGNALLDRLKAGEDFATVAEKESADTGTAKQGGDLGFFPKGVMDPAFDHAAFTLSQGELSGLVRSSFGFHILRVEEVRAGETKSFEDLKPELLTQWRREQADTAYFALIERLETLAFERGHDLAGLADELGVKMQSVQDLTPSKATGVLSNDKVLARAFDPELAKSAVASELIDLGDNQVVVLRVVDREEAEPLGFEAARERLSADFKADEARRRVAARGQEFLDRVKAGETFEAVAAAFGAEAKTLTEVTRSNPELPRAAARLAFRLSLDQAKPAYASTIAGSGNVLVVALDAIHAAPAAELEAAAKEPLAEGVSLRAQEEWETYLAELKRNAKIAVQDERL